MKRNILIILVGFVLSILIEREAVFGQIVCSPEAPRYCLFYEFHRDYVKLSHISSKFIVDLEDYRVGAFSTPSLYEADHIYEIQTSPNVNIEEDIVSEDLWRGVIYKVRTFYISVKEGDTYRLSYKTRILPHLHTRKPITPNVEYHLGVNMSAWQPYMKVFAFPPGTEIKEVFNSLPTKTIGYNGWRLLIYDLTPLENIAAHVRFVLPDKEIDELDTMKIFEEILK